MRRAVACGCGPGDECQTAKDAKRNLPGLIRVFRVHLCLELRDLTAGSLISARA